MEINRMSEVKYTVTKGNTKTEIFIATSPDQEYIDPVVLELVQIFLSASEDTDPNSKRFIEDNADEILAIFANARKV